MIHHLMRYPPVILEDIEVLRTSDLGDFLSDRLL